MLDHLGHRKTNFAGRYAAALAIAGAFMIVQGCSSDDSTATPQNEGGACPSGGGPEPGPAADHCMGMPPQEVGMCMPMGGDDAGGDSDAGPEEPAPTNVGHEADDDDCKYHVSFTNDCVQNGGAGTTFTVSLTSLTGTKAAVPGGKPYIESFIDNHPAVGGLDSTEPTPGTYKISPVMFDRSGKWTVRFHFFANCSDEPMDSPHAHAAFFIDVP
jgi:hypothetical protein